MVSERTQAILLLTTYLTNGSSDNVKPLSISEWNRLYSWLSAQNILPEALLESNLSDLFQSFRDHKVTVERLSKLLNRKSALAIALDKWDKVGIWILTILDEDYPKRLKDKLDGSAPPVIFGVGPISLLNKKYISIVGSRNASEKDLKVAHDIGQSICNQGMGIVSGGAKGVDERAMLGCLESEGNCVGILADSLMRRANSKLYREYIQRKDLTLISPYNPEAGFNAGNAMGRNKYVYCLSQAAIVVHSGEKGGTWEGAMENIRKGLVPIWVYPTGDAKSANKLIVEKGARWLPKDTTDIKLNALTNDSVEVSSGLFSRVYSNEESSQEVREPSRSVSGSEGSAKTNMQTWSDSESNSLSLFEYFVFRLSEIFEERQYFTKDDVTGKMDLVATQCNAWLKRAVEEEYLNKKKSPVRYYRNPFKKPPQLKSAASAQGKAHLR